jgi:hypothetical protein
MTIDELIVILEAAKAGKILQREEEGAWVDQRPFVYPLVHGNWRVKPEPREYWINPFDSRWVLDRQPINPDWIKVREVLE